MPIGFDYRCTQCGHEWTLFSKRFALGPVQWGASKYTCFSCQTSLSIASAIDSGSWSIWYRNHEQDVKRNAVVLQFAEAIESRVKSARRFTQVTITFASVECPMCGDAMSTIPFGEHKMKCPSCLQYTGEFQDDGCISTYGPDEAANGQDVGRGE